jgi:hypothetical protein
MTTIKYAAITTDNNSVGLVSYYNTAAGPFTDFQAAYHATNPNQQLVDIGQSKFPEGQGWSETVVASQGSGVKQYRPKGNIFQTIDTVRTKVVQLVINKMPYFEYSGTVTFKGKTFARDHETRDDIVLLANTVSISNSFATELLPLRVLADDNTEVSIDTIHEAQDFALSMLSPLKGVYAAEADQVAAIMAMTTITQLVQYIDPR